MNREKMQISIFLAIYFLLISSCMTTRLIKDPWDNSAQARYYDVQRMSESRVAAEFFAKGCAAVEQGDFKEAEQFFQNALIHDNQMWEALFELGRVQRALGNYQAALENLEMSRNHTTDHLLLDRELEKTRQAAVDHYLNKALELTQKGNPPEQIEQNLKMALEADPLNNNVLHALGVHYKNNQKPLLAIHYLRKIIEQDPNAADAYLKLCETYIDLNDYQSAELILDKAKPILRDDQRLEKLETIVKQKLILDSGQTHIMNLEQEDQLTRGQAAALIVSILEPKSLHWLHLPPVKKPIIALDVAGHWAEKYIREVLSYRIMKPFSNHTFKPDSHLYRYELAGILYYFLNNVEIDMKDKELDKDIKVISDVSPEHALYNAIYEVVRLRLMKCGDHNSFFPYNNLNGLETIRILNRFKEMVRNRESFNNITNVE